MSIKLETFQKSLIYEITASIETIGEDLNEIAVIDRGAEVKQAQFSKLLAISILGVILSFLLVLISLSLPTSSNGNATSLASALLGLGVIAGVGFIIAAIYAGIRKSRHSRLNLPNYRYELLRKLLGMLKRDMEEEASVNVRLVLSPPSQKDKKTITVSHPYRAGFKIDKFRDDWLSLNGVFRDKTDFSLTVTEFNQTNYGWKRTMRGKSKYKSKSNSKGLGISLILDYPLRKYGAIKVIKQEVMDAVKLPDIAQIKRLQVTDKAIKLFVKMPPDVAWKEVDNLYQTITMMFLSLYQVLNLARILSKSK